VSVTVRGLPPPESLTTNEPARVPAAVGVNVTAMEQDADAASDVPHVLDCAKSPLAAMFEIVSAFAVPFLSVTDCAALVMRIVWAAKVRLAGEMVTIPFAPPPRGPPLLDDEPPHAGTSASATLAALNPSCRSVVGRRWRTSTTSSAVRLRLARIASGSNATLSGTGLDGVDRTAVGTRAALVPVEMVSLDCADFAPGAMAAGSNVHAARAGKFVHASDTGAVYAPPSAVSVTV